MSISATSPRQTESTAPAGLTKSQYLAWREQLAFSHRFGVTVGVLLFDAGLAAAAMWMIFAVERGWPFWIGQALLALFYFHNFAIMHEAGHGNVHRRDWVNVIVGHYASLFCFLPFYPWRYIHHEHHTWTGNPEKDPTMKQILRMKDQEAGSLGGKVHMAFLDPVRSVAPAIRFLVLSDHRVPQRKDEETRANSYAYVAFVPGRWLCVDREVCGLGGPVASLAFVRDLPGGRRARELPPPPGHAYSGPSIAEAAVIRVGATSHHPFLPLSWAFSANCWCSTSISTPSTISSPPSPGFV